MLKEYVIEAPLIVLVLLSDTDSVVSGIVLLSEKAAILDC